MPRAKKLIIFQAVDISGWGACPSTNNQKAAKIYRAVSEQIEENHFRPFRNVKRIAASRAICTPLATFPKTATPAHGRRPAGHPAHQVSSLCVCPCASHGRPKNALMLKPMGLKRVHVPRAKKLIIFGEYLFLVPKKLFLALIADQTQKAYSTLIAESGTKLLPLSPKLPDLLVLLRIRYLLIQHQNQNIQHLFYSTFAYLICDIFLISCILTYMNFAFGDVKCHFHQLR